MSTNTTCGGTIKSLTFKGTPAALEVIRLASKHVTLGPAKKRFAEDLYTQLTKDVFTDPQNTGLAEATWIDVGPHDITKFDLEVLLDVPWPRGASEEYVHERTVAFIREILGRHAEDLDINAREVALAY